MKSTNEKQSLIHGFPVAPSVTKKRACEFLCISESTIERLEKSKELLPIRIGRHVTYDFDDLVAYRNSKKVAA